MQETPAAAVIFDFLERHWPTLVNGIESRLTLFSADAQPRIRGQCPLELPVPAQAGGGI